jgi:hypothetical protein
MASKKHTTNPRRFRVERGDSQFIILDTVDCKYTSCAPSTSRFQAEQQCAALNSGAPPTNRKRYPEYGSRTWGLLHSAFFPVFLSVDGGAYRIRVRGESETPPRRAPVVGQEQDQLVDGYKNWLPTLLRDWADEVAAQCGFSGDRRTQWSTWAILNLIRADTPHHLAQADLSIRELHLLVMPSTYLEYDSSENLQRREVLAMHYLSAAEPAHIKAGFLGMSKATYLRYLDAGHRLVARRWLS